VSNFLYKLGKKAASKSKRVLFTFIASIAILGGAAGAVGAGYSTEVRLGDTDSQQASDLLIENFAAASGDSATLVFHSDSAAGLVETSEATAIADAIDEIDGQVDVESITPIQFSADKKTGFVNVQYTKLASDLSAEHLNRLEKATEQVSAAGVESSMRGPVVDRWRDRMPPVGEFIGILAAIIFVTLLF